MPGGARGGRLGRSRLRAAFRSAPWRHTWPFVAIAALAFPVAATAGSGPRRPLLLAAAFMAFLIDGFAVLLIRPLDLPRWVRQVPVAVWCGGIIALSQWRDPADTYIALLLLAVVWQAALGDRRDLFATLGLVALTLVLVVVGLPDHDHGVEARRALLWMGTAAGTGLMVQALVASNVRKEEAMAEVVRLAGALDQAPDPAAAVVEAAGSLTGADVVVLHRAPGEHLVWSATWPPELGRPPVEPGPASGPARAARGEHQGRVVVHVERTDDPVAKWFEDAGVGIVLHVAPQRQGWATLVLSLGWCEERSDPPDEVGTIGSLLAHEAWVALGRAELVANLATAASHDQLTGLLNRRAWDELLAEEVDHARRLHRPLALALLDLDHFKDFNDRHGHVRGDELLAAAAQAWTDELREGDSLARWGGEEFVVALPGTGLDEARRVIERLRTATPGVTVSAGVAMLRPGMSPTELVRAADQALYEAKRAGRDRTVLADDDAGGPGPTGPVS